MNIAMACMVFFLAATQAWPEETDGTEGNYWPSPDQNQADLEDAAYDRYLTRIARKLKPDHFYGVMGKRISESKRTSPKRQKIDSFIGLMGRRSLSSESKERNSDYDYRRRRK
ncbi:protachykinin-1-like [Hyla sarda]|uniref:protachykinin-1-like n=1 Tax=Hyla sarda TaxID=327740 RepID=UPI0024C27E27|nr:protachykinin-1-like [Hyla sarda]XP_056374919.1 protachykinin-1-like [Hyla sarda]XP_056374920.1 protachykinin-1-like [Hyla sarda]XP_056374921.1 protachykinin-1-like [Hyla sarda]XP_056374923.1 protachykinin-1-like [Hyla sarda]XP_056374924.1 protachykinin-1-like [Hyla sarda]XP_056374925.1 protachykinin-1-like [Hyla sarda]XP_056374926.1 protachykinin-1-like [Hyla sarda]XP_056374927.1 protachykinin-1-like [Hyla sarda]XP_056374928.1 protachykinin-1-like [Hyla sarda]XP_056374929.1 protachyki